MFLSCPLRIIALLLCKLTKPNLRSLAMFKPRLSVTQ
jgi:hypothetical protein